MREAYSLNTLEDGRIDYEALASVPPGCEKFKITGLLTFHLSLRYIAKPHPHLLFRTRLWGREHEELTFRRINQNEAVLSLAMRSTLQNTSQYFADMAAICIDCFTSPKEEARQPLHTGEFTHYGRIFIGIRRYVVSFMLGDFEDSFPIVDGRKNKVGEVGCRLTVEQGRRENLYPVATQPEIQHGRLHSADVSIRPSHDHSPSHPVRMPDRKDSFQNSEFAERKEAPRNSLDQFDGKRNTMIEHKPDLNQEEAPWKPERRRGKAAQFLEDYSKNKPEHTELSIIRSKYGYNCPSIEVMKLKLDEAILLSNHQEAAFKDGSRINLLLKSIKNHGKAPLDSLTVVYQQNQHPLKTETKILLGEQLNGKIEVNYLYVLQKAAAEDTLVLEVREARAQLSIAGLRGKDTIELKARNGKKVATLEFAFIEEQFSQPTQHLPTKQDRQVEQRQDDPSPSAPRTKENCFLKVEGAGKGQVTLRNKKIGSVNGPKVMYELEREEQSLVEVELGGRERHFIKIAINHLLKEEHFVVEGKPIKITTARGELKDLLTLLAKIDTAEAAENREKSEDQSVDAREIANVFEKLETCENQECNEIMQALSKEFNPRKLQRLSSLIGVNAQSFEKLLDLSFNSNFSKFSQAFLTYHAWNHRYLCNQRKVVKIIQGTVFSDDLLRVVKRLKRSSEVVFGIVPSSAFLNEFLRCSERNLTEQTESEFSREQLGKLIILLLQRYPSKCIKISQLESFVNHTHSSFHLNAYLLTKMTQEIRMDPDSFQEALAGNEESLLDVLRSECEGELGLAKLLLTAEEDMEHSSTISHPSTDRRQTDPVQEEDPHLKTERSKQEEKRSEHEQNHLPTEHDPKQLIMVIISSIHLPDIDSIEQLEIFSDHGALKLQRDQILFPKAVELPKDSTNTVIVSTAHDRYEGVFIASVRPQTVKLFSNGAEAGTLKIFLQLGKPKASEDEEITVRIENTEMRRLPFREELNREEEQIAEIKCIAPIAKSPFVKLIIRSIRPTRASYRLVITSASERKTLSFPNENEIILKNSDEGWRVTMVDQEVEEVVVSNHLASNPYCFVESDQRVAFTAVAEVEECWEPQLSLGFNESLHLIIHFDELLSARQIEAGDYALFSDSEPKIPIVNFSNQLNCCRINIYQSVSVQSLPERVSVKLVNASKEEIAEFRFALKLTEEGIASSTRYLLSSVGGYRLKVTAFQVRHSWEYCRPDRVISLFNSQNRRTIQSWIRALPDFSEEKLVGWIKANFHLALSEITILLEELLHRLSQGPVEAFLNLFARQEKREVDGLAEIKDEFAVFDYNDEGVISEDQLRIAKKVFSRSFKAFYPFLLESESLFVPSPELPNNFIIDLSAAIKSSNFDYLSFLNLMEDCEQAGGLQKKKNEPREEKKELEVSEYLSVRILEFQNLSMSKLPCTLLFRVNDQTLAEPIHKCYSFKYSSASQIVVPSKPAPQLQVFLQTLKSNGTWDYKLIETLPLREEVKVLGGSITFSLQPTDQRRPTNNHYNKQHIANENQDDNGTKPRSRNQYSSPKRQLEADRSFSESMNKEFSKSFWNKSLNETKQKWSQWKENRKGEKEAKGALKYEEKAEDSEEQY